MQCSKPIIRRVLSSSLTLSPWHCVVPQRRTKQLCRMSTQLKARPRLDRNRRHPTTPRRYATAAELPRILVNDLRGQEVVVEFEDGRAVRYPSFWLRDHCPCSECTHPHTKQRQLDTFSVNPDIKATSAVPTTSGLEITWSDESQHTSAYPWLWLQKHEPFTAKPQTLHQRSGWQHVSPASPTFPTVEYEPVMTTDAGLSAFLTQIRVYGLSFVADTPPTPEATKSLLERIAFIRHTHWGGFWDFTSDPTPTDTAYTDSALPAHTDNTYFTDPCGLQMFHVLTPGTSGGESTFVDGFAAAQHLYKSEPKLYQILASIPIVSHASGDAAAGTIVNTSSSPSGHPVFTHATPHQPALYRPGNLTQVRWNNADRHSGTVWPSHQSMRDWYAAARAWSDVLASKNFEIGVKLLPGTPVIFDNWRVLHGRSAFEGRRRVCGAYIGMDDFLARERLLAEKVEGQVVEASRSGKSDGVSEEEQGMGGGGGGEDIGLTKTENEKLASMGGS